MRKKRGPFSIHSTLVTLFHTNLVKPQTEKAAVFSKTHFTMKNTGKTHKSHSFNGRTTDVRKDRKSATGMNGSPKKRGHGGKFTWSGDGYSEAEMGFKGESVVDFRDPNFEDPEDEVLENKVDVKAN